MPRDTAVVTALILERPLCGRCIADKSGLETPQVLKVLETIGEVLSLRRRVDRCRACGAHKPVFFLDRPSE
jgi:hypothetical protein